MQPLLFRGKAISCLVENGQYFVLLEVLNAVYFPGRSLKTLMAVLQVLGVTARMLTVREEMAFIAFYSLPTRALNCKKVVNMAAVAKHFAALYKTLCSVTCLDEKGMKVSEPNKSTSSQYSDNHMPFRPWLTAGKDLSRSKDDTSSESANAVGQKQKQEQSYNVIVSKARRLEEAIDKIRCGNVTQVKDHGC